MLFSTTCCLYTILAPISLSSGTSKTADYEFCRPHNSWFCVFYLPISDSTATRSFVSDLGMELTFFAGLSGTFISEIHPNTELESVTAPLVAEERSSTHLFVSLQLQQVSASSLPSPSTFIPQLFNFCRDSWAWNVWTAPVILDTTRHDTTRRGSGRGSTIRRDSLRIADSLHPNRPPNRFFESPSESL